MIPWISASTVAVAGDAALEGGERHHHDIVLILAEAGRALGLQHADDLAGGAADADQRAGGVAGAEELGAHRLAEQADAAAAAVLRIGEGAAQRHVPVAGDEIFRLGAGDLNREIVGAEHDAHGLLRGRRDGAYILELRGKPLDIFIVELFRGEAGDAAAHRPGGLHDQQIAAQLGDVLLYLLGGARADGDHRDHGGDADDDAEQGQEGAQRVAAHRAKRETDGFDEHQAASRALSRAMRPSRKAMVRSA